jgi:uncharacterized protein involved in type VI secretion and phage assembly
MSVLDILQQEDKREDGRVEGVATGIVTNNKDDEGLGRIKVRYPWREDRQDSYWARPARPGAGNDRGVFWLPEVGDEVLLAFDKGKIEHPYYLGSLWNGKDKPPAGNSDGENNTRLIRTRSGHEFRLFDKAGQETVELKSKGGHHLLLDDSSGSATIEIKDSSGSNKIVIKTAENSISIESGLSLKIRSQTIDIEAGASMSLKATGTLTIQGGLVRIN